MDIASARGRVYRRPPVAVILWLNHRRGLNRSPRVYRCLSPQETLSIVTLLDDPDAALTSYELSEVQVMLLRSLDESDPVNERDLIILTMLLGITFVVLSFFKPINDASGILFLDRLRGVS
jgi:hypothetical protein